MGEDCVLIEFDDSISTGAVARGGVGTGVENECSTIDGGSILVVLVCIEEAGRIPVWDEACCPKLELAPTLKGQVVRL
jgi:hypothetical protein